MKLSLLGFIIIGIISCIQNEPSKNSSIRIETIEHNFGTLQYKKGAEYSFQFTNPGKTPLVIYDVKTSCGCSVPEWIKKPIKPGKTGEIKIKYDAAFPGVFHKEISVYYNGKDSPVKLTQRRQLWCCCAGNGTGSKKMDDKIKTSCIFIKYTLLHPYVG